MVGRLPASLPPAQRVSQGRCPHASSAKPSIAGTSRITNLAPKACAKSCARGRASDCSLTDGADVPPGRSTRMATVAWHDARCAPSEPDPHLGAPRAHRRVDRSPARGHRPADRSLQEGERPRFPTGSRRRPPAVDFDDEIDLRAEDDALIAAELEAEAARRPRTRRPGRGAPPTRTARTVRRRAPTRSRRGAAVGAAAAGAGAEDGLRLRGHVRPRRGGLRPVARPGRRRRRASTPSTGPATVRSRSRSRRTRS